MPGHTILLSELGKSDRLGVVAECGIDVLHEDVADEPVVAQAKVAVIA